MDFEILPQLIIVFSMAGILAIIGKNFSKMKEAGSEEIFLQESEKEKQEKEKFIYLYKRATRRLNKESYQKKMADFWLWSEKFLRKLRILFLKMDGKMLSILEQLRKKNAESLENLRKHSERNIYGDKAAEALSRFLSHNIGNRKSKPSKNAEEKSEKDPIDGRKIAEIEIVTEAEAKVAASGEYSQEVETGMIEPVFSSDIAGYEEQIPQAQENNYRTFPEENFLEPESDKANQDSTISDISEEVCAEDAEEEVKEVKEKDDKEEKLQETEEETKIRTRKEQEYIEILMKNPMDIKAYWKLGVIYSKRRNYEDALACFRQIVKIDPTYTKAKQKAIELMEKMKGKVK